MHSVPERAWTGLLIPMVLIGLLLAGCAPASSGGSSSHMASQTNAPLSTGHDATPRDDLTHESVIPWSRYERVSANQLRFYYTGGDPACYGVRVDMHATDAILAAATIVGTIADAPAECTLIASLSSVIITTDTPIGERTVIHLENPSLHR